MFTDYLGSGNSSDRISSAEWLEWFLEHYDLVPRAAVPPLGELIHLRRDLRRILEKWSTQATLGARDIRVLDTWIRVVTGRQRVVGTGEGPTLLREPLRRDWSWVMAAITESAVELMVSADPERLKTCANPDCSWMFYDTSINRSKRFCSTSPCGSLIRVRRFRESK